MMKGILPGNLQWAKHGEDNYGLLHLQTPQGVKTERIESITGCYEDFYHNIVQHISGKEPLRFTAQQALLAVEVLLAAEESHKTQRTVYF
jgi:scyllo-inositol 2-dehydrogenase (NADP+)